MGTIVGAVIGSLVALVVLVLALVACVIIFVKKRERNQLGIKKKQRANILDKCECHSSHYIQWSPTNNLGKVS